ncbi:TPA: virulence factor TspB C-terminal domain-related protein [Neisseria meningitidis]|uniref:virulence factor TspB C-terminal domain-related protein n=1 Tax=Neisseria TaxID=482 RepID=UPI000543FBA2|nr:MULTISPECIES: virulence factor TspB C-terminal domain-related protein [Neisseria]ANX17672.1 TspB protein [Neisseria meningitidis]KHC97386.1 neisseria meningitidis TspB family protein [Neisseria meningitidis]KIF89538.1 neisseria meningitidis TspB family protein [Neisseria meningitidis]KIF90762.1 neisseria meningitidis TspB family protein [Neisseria meningitidis]MCL4993471.1 TspB protein [Neisseria meningitidis]
MKNNAPRNSIFNRRRPLSVLLLGVVVPYAQVRADVPPPPPPPVNHQNAGFPSAQKLEQMGYNRETGVWKVQTNPTGKPTVSSGGGQITGTQGQRVTVTDAYGNKATVNTQVTQRVNTGRIEAAIGGTLAGLSASGRAIGSDYAAWAYRDIKAGDWGDAARNSVGAILSGLEALDITGFGYGINNFLDKTGIRSSSSGQQLGQIAAQQQQAQAQAERAGDFSAAVVNAAAAKAATAAAEAERAEELAKEQLKPKIENGKVLKPFLIRIEETGYRYAANGNGGEKLESEPKWTSAYLENDGGRLVYGYSYFQKEWGETVNINADGFKTTYKFKHKDTPRYISNGVYKGYYDIGLSVKAYPVNSSNIRILTDPNPKDFMLNQQEVAGILNRMLEDQNTNHAELMNQLAKMGNVVPDSTTSTEFKPATATTAPYTPAGSNTPQQTQITINQDGSVKTSVIPRPDLVPNSPQAPTRSALIPNNPSTPDNQTAPNMPKEDQLPQENTAYEEPDIPTQTVDLDFKPADIFSVDGVCPEPKSVDFGMFGKHEFSYDPLCDFSRKLRPVLILITIVSCSFFVYSSLKD